MSFGTAIAVNNPEQVLLRWFEGANSASREEFVDLVESQAYEVLVRSTLQVSENTQVYLTGKQYTANGVARSCRKDASSFIVTILIEKDSVVQRGHQWDPGVFAVEDFLTEQQEAEILQMLPEDASHSTFPRLTDQN